MGLADLIFFLQKKENIIYNDHAEEKLMINEITRVFWLLILFPLLSLYRTMFIQIVIILIVVSILASSLLIYGQHIQYTITQYLIKDLEECPFGDVFGPLPATHPPSASFNLCLYVCIM